MTFDIFGDIWPLFVFVVGFSAIMTIPFYRSASKVAIFAVVISLAMVGVTTGFITGNSRAPAVAAVLPSVLTVVGGVAVYLFGRSDRSTIMLVSLAVLALSTNLLVGTVWGSRVRQHFTDERNSADFRWERILDNAGLLRKMEWLEIPREAYVPIEPSKEEKEQGSDK